MSTIMNLPAPQTPHEPNALENPEHLAFIKAIKKVKWPKNEQDTAKLRDDAVLASLFLARVAMRYDDFGEHANDGDVKILELLQDRCVKFCGPTNIHAILSDLSDSLRKHASAIGLDPDTL